MNNELMRDENFIRCSTMIAELLMKYKSMETEEDQEGWMQEGASSPLLFCAWLYSRQRLFCEWISLNSLVLPAFNGGSKHKKAHPCGCAVCLYLLSDLIRPARRST